MNDRKINGGDENVVPIGKREPTANERTAELLVTFSQLVIQSFENQPPLQAGAIVATLEIQGMQLESLIDMIVNDKPRTADEFNKSMRLRLKANIQAIRSRPRIVVADGQIPPPQ